jgi:choline dehydrogenase-like flavoprotein
MRTGTTAMAPRNLGGKITLPTYVVSTYLTGFFLSGVVDPRLKIYGLTNVRVVDASVIPLTTGVAIQSTVYAIAEKVRAGS